ncbi:MAG: hypothetical protein QF440_05430 [Candidatus Thalassarchaeaceae archaeon]|jgi:hypothetical protein|nr:hypothetical protein [Candidatus Thalassarchaeaceae archaeon]
MSDDESGRGRFRNIVIPTQTKKSNEAYIPGFAVNSITELQHQSNAQFGMIISLGGGVIALLLGIWTFMVTDADADITFLWLSLGSIVAVAVTFSLVEIQYRRQGILSIMHDYLLSFGLLFGMLGSFWISRYGLFFICGHGADSSGFCQGDTGAEDWLPGAWGIVAQSSFVAVIAVLSWYYTKRVNGSTLPRLVLVLAPLAILIIGADVWVAWAEGDAGLPLVIGVLLMTTLSMSLASMSDRSPLFLTAAAISSIAPFIYEMNLDGPAGSGLSMLTMIVIVQGIFAASPGLSRTMIEKGSVGLVGIVILAQWVSGSIEADFILIEPIQNSWITLNLMLWLSLLVGYFWPVHMRRVPSMPIGLGFALLLIPTPGSMLAWCLAILSFIYMLTVPQTRRWVADWTFIAMMFAWWAGGWISSFESDIASLDPIFIAIPPLALTITGYFATRENRLSSNALNIGIIMIILSNELLSGTEPWLPLGVATSLLLMVWVQAREAESIIAAGDAARLEATGRMALALVGILVLELANRLTIPWIDVNGIHIEALILATALYAIGRGLRGVEVDIGHLLAKISARTTSIPEWDPNTASWVYRPSVISEKMSTVRFGPAARLGLAGPLLLFSLALSRSGDPFTDHYLVVLLALPITLLLREILLELPNDDKTRAAGIWTLFLIALPSSLALHFTADSSLDENTIPASLLLFDSLLLMGPILGDVMLHRRGLEGEKDMKAGSIALLGLLALAILDTSGGFLALPLFAIVLMRGFMHRQGPAIHWLGFAWIFWILTMDLESTSSLIALVPEVTVLVETSFFDLPRWAGLGLIAIGLPSLYGAIQDIRATAKGLEVDEHSHPILAPTMFIIAGVFLLIPDAHWLSVGIIILASIGAWLVGKMGWFWIASPLLFISLIYAGEVEWGGAIGETIRFAAAGTFAFNAILFITNSREQFFKNSDDSWDEIRQGNLVDVITIGAFIASLIADDYFFGIALLLGALLMTKYAHGRRWSNFLVFWLPLAHSWVIYRILADPLPEANVEIAGLVLLVESILLTWSSWTMYDFGWDDFSDDEVLEHANTSGWLGAVLFIPAAWFTVIDMPMWMFGGMLCVHSAGQMALGFQRNESWRRIYSLIGVAVGFLIIAIDIENGIMRGVMLVLASLTMMMQGILYMTEAGIKMAGTGEGDVVDEVEEAEPKTRKKLDLTSLLSIPDPVLDTKDDVEEGDVDPSEEIELSLPRAKPVSAEPLLEERIRTEHYDLELPVDVRDRIGTVITSTPHEGFHPVIRWDQWGQVILDWEPISK